MSGHSKWSQIKHKKAASDVKKGQLFSKLLREITVAIRKAGSDPDANARLRSAIERGRAAGLPKDNIERAIERASGKEAGVELTEFLYEAAAPGGVAILIEGITDSKNRTLAEIRHLLTQYGGRLAEPGAVLWNFEKVGLLECGAGNAPKTKEEMELAIIEAGASDFLALEDAWLVQTPFTERERVRESLEGQSINVIEPSHDYKPRIPLELNPSERGKIEPLLDALAEHPDVQEVYTNLRV